MQDARQCGSGGIAWRHPTILRRMPLFLSVPSGKFWEWHLGLPLLPSTPFPVDCSLSDRLTKVSCRQLLAASCS
jgi:hypothetical protein